MPADKPAKPKPHFHGHRARLKERFLAQGGDGYIKKADLAEPKFGRLTLRGLVRDAVRHGGVLPDAPRLRGRSAWKTEWKSDMSMALTSLQGLGDADDGENAMAWNGSLTGEVEHVTANRQLTWDFRTRFGQVLQEGRLDESSDRIDSKLRNSWHNLGIDPFVAVDVNTEWSPREGRDHKLTVRSSSGVETELGPVDVSFGLGWERDYEDDESQLGFEVVPEYSFNLGRNIKAEMEAEIFYAAFEERLSVEQYNSLEIKLARNLKLTAEANTTFEQDGKKTT